MVPFLFFIETNELGIVSTKSLPFILLSGPHDNFAN